MPNNMRMAKKGMKKKSRSGINPPESVVVYNGPLKIPQGEQERQLFTTVLHYGPAAVNSSGAGAIVLTVGDDPSGFVDWSHFAATWDEYRVLGFVFHYEPYQRYNQVTTVVCGPVFGIIDRDDSTALATQSAALEYGSLESFRITDPYKREIRSMVSIEDATFLTTASPAARNWYKVIGTAFSNSTAYGEYWLDIFVQFRGRN